MDSLYAACAKADLFFRFGGSLVGAPVAALWALYFALIDPTAASHHACFEMKNPSVRFIRRAWAPINSPLLVAGAQAISFVKGLRFQRHTTIAGVPCMVYAAHNPATAAGGDGDDSAGGNGGGGDGGSFGGNADEMSRDYVLYVHGGAFVASLHAADLGVISEWAVRFEKAVVVVPDYSLAPECPYPQVVMCDVRDEKRGKKELFDKRSLVEGKGVISVCRVTDRTLNIYSFYLIFFCCPLPFIFLSFKPFQPQPTPRRLTSWCECTQRSMATSSRSHMFRLHPWEETTMKTMTFLLGSPGCGGWQWQGSQRGEICRQLWSCA
jgi:hypothetical protein